MNTTDTATLEQLPEQDPNEPVADIAVEVEQLLDELLSYIERAGKTHDKVQAILKKYNF